MATGSLAPSLRLEWAGLAALVALAVFFVATSWRRWPDPLIDFGRELYLPWRLAEGAVLYRDLYGHYGPLAQYFNALLFACFGPGLMVLVAANLAIFAAIVSLFYLLCRRAWGVASALISSAVFISVFGFSQLVWTSNYNYATPYAHETTHGMLVSLLLVWALLRWTENGTPRWSFFAGFCWGLSALLKPEFMLAGGAAALAALFLRTRASGFPGARSCAAGLAGAIFPTLGFAAYFSAFLPLRDAFAAASRAWLRFAGAPSGMSSGIQGGFSGLDAASSHFTEHLLAVLIASAVVLAIGLAGWSADRAKQARVSAAIALLLTLAGALISCFVINWLEIGKCLPGLTLLFLAAHFLATMKSPIAHGAFQREAARCLLAVLALTLMTRMALNGRIYQYGFYQAALAGSLLPGALLAELPEWLCLRNRGRRVVWLAFLVLLIPGVCRIVAESQALLRRKTAAVGEGRDRFFTFPERMEATGEIVGAVSKFLAQRKPGRTLLVLPEGIMINYLSRLRSPSGEYFFLSTTPEQVRRLESHPPDLVVIVSRNLREYGVERYGARLGQGREIMEWLSRDYRQIAHVRGDPFDVRQRGALILERATRE